MPRQLTPEERAIIRETVEQGNRDNQAEEAGRHGRRTRMVASWLMLAGFITVLILCACLILSIR